MVFRMVLEPIGGIVDVQNLAVLCDKLSDLSKYRVVDVLDRRMVHVGHAITSLEQTEILIIVIKTFFTHHLSLSHHFKNPGELWRSIVNLFLRAEEWKLKCLLTDNIVIH
jgi:hypothetical protein